MDFHLYVLYIKVICTITIQWTFVLKHSLSYGFVKFHIEVQTSYAACRLCVLLLKPESRDGTCNCVCTVSNSKSGK